MAEIRCADEHRKENCPGHKAGYTKGYAEEDFGVRMITRKDIQKIINGYDLKDIHIGTLGGHSALDICNGAKKYGLKTVVVCQKGREKTYSDYYRNLVDEIILVDKFGDVVKKEVQEKLRRLNTIFVHSRYFWVYCNFDEVENDFKVPIFGSRSLLRAEERTGKKNQYHLLGKAGIKYPKQFSNPQAEPRALDPRR